MGSLRHPSSLDPPLPYIRHCGLRIVFQLERARAILQKTSGGLGKLCIVIDYVGFTLRNAPPMKTSMASLNIVQNHYPETLGRAFFVSPPFFFNGFWKV